MEDLNKELDRALEYANASNGIEDMSLTEEEKEYIKKLIEKGMSDGSLFYTIVKEIEEEHENKTRK